MKTFLLSILLLQLSVPVFAGQASTIHQAVEYSATQKSTSTISNPSRAGVIQRFWTRSRKVPEHPKKPGRLSFVLSLIGGAMIAAGMTAALSLGGAVFIGMFLPFGMLVMFFAIVFGAISLYRHRESRTRDRRLGLAGLLLGVAPFALLISWGLGSTLKCG